MGWQLNSQSDLTVGQREHADKLGISHEVFKKYLLERLDEIKKNIIPEKKHGDRLYSTFAENPVLIVGAGPSYRKYLKEIKNFKGDIIVVDVNFNYCVENGICPDFVLTLESNLPIVNEKTFKTSNLKLVKDITVIGSAITKDEIVHHLHSNNIGFLRWNFNEEPRCSNVGLFAINFAYYFLEADKILLVGFEHVGQEYAPETYTAWQTDFWHFIRKFPKNTIVNCTNDGALYDGDYVLEATLDNLKINSSMSKL